MTHRILRLELGVALAALLLGACGAAQPKQAGEENNFDSTPKEKAAEEGTPPEAAKAPSKSKEAAEDLNDAQKTQMEIALRRGGDKAANCTSVVPDAVRGEGEVKVTFDGKKGRATDVAVGAPWAGTPAEACIKRAFVGEIIVPFEGELEVPYTVKLTAKGGDSDKGTKGKKK